MSAGRVSVGHPVDVGSGSVFTLSDDFRIPGSIAIRWRRHYSTVAAANSWLGPKWSVPYFMRLERQPDRYILSGAHGEEVFFPSPLGPLLVSGELSNLTANMEIRREPDQYRVLHWHLDGHVSLFYFDVRPNGRMPLTAIANLSGHRVRMEYDTKNRPIRIVQELEQRTLEVAYDQKDLISAIHFVGDSARKLLVRYEYDTERRLIAAFDALGHRKGYEYDRDNLMTAETNPLGSRFEFQYDRFGRCTRSAGIDGFMKRRLQYQTTPRITRVTDSRGSITEYHLNAAGQVVQIVNPIGGVTTNTFDENGRLIAVTQPDGATETFAYDDRGNLAAASDPSGAPTTTKHDENHVPTASVDPHGTVWNLANKNEGSLLGVEDLPPLIWTYSRDGRGLVTTAESSGGRQVQVRRDPRFCWQENHDQFSLVARTEFDEMGYPTEVRDAAGLVSRTRYDELHRPIEVTRANSDLVRYQWTAGGRISERIEPGDERLTWLYDHYGYVVAQINALGDAVSFEYDKEGALTTITNRVGDRVEYRYDAYGRVVEERLFDGRVRRIEYDLSGRQVKIHLPDGRSVSQKFDPAGRLILREASDGLVDEFAYDKLGRAVKASNNHAIVELVRDRFGNIRAEIQNGRAVAYQYDADNRRISRSLPFRAVGCKLRRNFDVRGRLTAIGEEVGPRQHLRWDDLDRLVERRCPGGLVEFFTYDDNRRLNEHRVESNDGRFVWTHTYDRSGNLARLVDERNARTEYTYDGINRLIEVRRNGLRDEAYEYDANHAIRATHRGPRRLGSGGRVVHDGSRVFSHAADGSVVEIHSNGVTRRLKHDVYGRLVEIAEPNDAVSSNEYDPFGRRTAKVVAGVRTEFLWEGWSLAAEVRGDDVLRVHASLELRPLAQWQNGRQFIPILDHRGAVRLVFDGSGRRRWNCALDAYGRLLSETGDIPSPFRLRGQYHDAESGLFYNFYRHYDPELGDYTAPDPIGIEGGYNLYAYPRNPMRWDDPFGLICVNDKDGKPIPADDPRHPPDPNAPPKGDPNKPGHGPVDVGEENKPHLPLSKEEAAARNANAEKAMDAVGIPKEQQGYKPGEPYNHDIHDPNGHPAAGENRAGMHDSPDWDPKYNSQKEKDGGIVVGPAVHDDNPPTLKGQNLDESWKAATPEERAQAVAQHEKTEKAAREEPKPGDPPTFPPRPMSSDDAHNHALNQGYEDAKNNPNISENAKKILKDQQEKSPRVTPTVPNPPADGS